MDFFYFISAHNDRIGQMCMIFVKVLEKQDALRWSMKGGKGRDSEEVGETERWTAR
jgi:hypothetical protein